MKSFISAPNSQCFFQIGFLRSEKRVLLAVKLLLIPSFVSLNVGAWELALTWVENKPAPFLS